MLNSEENKTNWLEAEKEETARNYAGPTGIFWRSSVNDSNRLFFDMGCRETRHKKKIPGGRRKKLTDLPRLSILTDT